MNHQRLLSGMVITLMMHTSGMAQTLPSDVRRIAPALSVYSEAGLKFLGFDIYKARLWRGVNFDANQYTEHEFVLDLYYLRNFQGKDIAKRSTAEMRRQFATGKPDEALLQSWGAQMLKIFPDVQAGDYITGLHQPGKGAKFWHNGQLLGEITDTEFAKYFFGIWLSKQTSEPKLRQALLETKPRPVQPK